MRLLFAIFIVLGAPVDSKACFKNTPELVKYSFGKYIQPGSLEFSPAVNNFCKETMYKDNFKKLAGNEISIDKIKPRLKMLIDAQSADFKTQYEEQITKIKNIDLLEQRLKETYNLSVRLYGFLEYNKKKFITNSQMADIKTLDNLKNEFLAYSLLQIKRNEAEFTVKMLTTFPESSLNSRQWVRIEISDKDNQQLDLDPSVTGLQYLPLPIRHNGIDEESITVIQHQCENLIKCLVGTLKSNKGEN